MKEHAGRSLLKKYLIYPFPYGYLYIDGMNGAVGAPFSFISGVQAFGSVGRRPMIPDEQLSSTVEKEIELLGYELLKFDLISRGRRKVLRIYIDRPEGNVSVADCVKVSKAVGFVLEGEELIQGPYNLEVSSPGNNRPLVKPAHFERFTGHGARVEYSADAGEKKTVIGEISRVGEDSVVIAAAGEELAIGFDRIIKASLHGENWDIGGTKGRGMKRTGKTRKRKRF